MTARLTVVGTAVLALALLVGVVVMRSSSSPSAVTEPGGTASASPSAARSASPTPFAFPSVAVPATTTPQPTVSPTPTVEPTASAAAAPAQTSPPQTSAAQTQAPAATRAPVAQAPVTQAPAPQPTEAPAPVVTPAPTPAPTQPPPPPPPATTAPPPATTTPPPSGGFVFPTLFVTITDSRNGRVAVVTSPGASCSAIARLPDNVTVLQLGTQIAPSSGMLAWTYPPAPPSPNLGVHKVDCALGSERTSAEARFIAN